MRKVLSAYLGYDTDAEFEATEEFKDLQTIREWFEVQEKKYREETGPKQKEIIDAAFSTAFLICGTEALNVWRRYDHRQLCDMGIYGFPEPPHWYFARAPMALRSPHLEAEQRKLIIKTLVDVKLLKPVPSQGLPKVMTTHLKARSASRRQDGGQLSGTDLCVGAPRESLCARWASMASG